jgi:hypothetical protein
MGQSRDAERVSVLMPEEYNGSPWSFFTHHVGNSWHGADAQLIFWVGYKLHLQTKCLTRANMCIDAPLLGPIDRGRLHPSRRGGLLHVVGLRPIAGGRPLPISRPRVFSLETPSIEHYAQLPPADQLENIDLVGRGNRSQVGRLL